MGDVVRVRDFVEILKTPEPGSASLPILDFELARRSDHALSVNGHVRALRFTDPVDRIIQRGDLPRRVRWRLKTILVVKRFGEREILVDERAAGFRVRAEVYYEEDA